MGIEISTGSLSKILLSHTEVAETDKLKILSAGLLNKYSQTDKLVLGLKDKIARHISLQTIYLLFLNFNSKSILDVLTAYQGLSDQKYLNLIYNEKTNSFLNENNSLLKIKNL